LCFAAIKAAHAAGWVKDVNLEDLERLAWQDEVEPEPAGDHALRKGRE
jgi:hypothetical protein